VRTSSLLVAWALVSLIGLAACTPKPSGPIPDPTYVRFVSVDPDTSSTLSGGAVVRARANIFADHKYNQADLALYVQTDPGKLLAGPVFRGIPAGPGQYTLEQTFTVPASATRIYLIAALYRQGEDDSTVSTVAGWDVRR